MICNFDGLWVPVFIWKSYWSQSGILIQWWWCFIEAGLGRTTLDSISCRSSLEHFQTKTSLASSQVKRERCLLKSVFFPTPYSWTDLQYLFLQFASHFSLIELNLNSWFSWTEFQVNEIWIQLDAMSFKYSHNKWNLIFTKSIHFFHQLIITGSVRGAKGYIEIYTWFSAPPAVSWAWLPLSWP
jgi:hypothetical protein